MAASSRDWASPPPTTYSKPGGEDDRLNHFHITEKNTFLNVDLPVDEFSLGFSNLRRQISAPASQSVSVDSQSSSSSVQGSWSTNGDTTPRRRAAWADIEDDFEDEEEPTEMGDSSSTLGVQSSGGGRSRGKKTGRPCKSRRFRFKAFVERAEIDMRKDPYSCNIETFEPPAFIREDPRLMASLMSKLSEKLEQIKEALPDGRIPHTDAAASTDFAPLASGHGSSSSSRRREQQQPPQQQLLLLQQQQLQQQQWQQPPVAAAAAQPTAASPPSWFAPVRAAQPLVSPSQPSFSSGSDGQAWWGGGGFTGLGFSGAAAQQMPAASWAAGGQPPRAGGQVWGRQKMSL